MKIEDISRSMQIGQISMASINRSSGPETMLLLKRKLRKDILPNQKINIEISTCIFSKNKVKPVILMTKLNTDKDIYSVWIDLCDSAHSNLLENLKGQETIPIVLSNELNEVECSFEIRNSIKNEIVKMLDDNLNFAWDKISFYEETSKVINHYSSSRVLWDEISKNESDTSLN